MQLKILVQASSQEVKWRDEQYIPKTINEHLEMSRATVGGFQVACSSFVGMGDIITKETLDWLLTYPELLKCLSTTARLSNDIKSTEVSRPPPPLSPREESLCVFMHHSTILVKLKFTIKLMW
jgi:beta-farnesene synthase